MSAKSRRVVLIVDDDPEWINFLSIAIGNDYHVISADDGDDAIAKARSVRPAAILLDVMMAGGKDGFSTYCELCHDDSTMEIPVIMLSEVKRETGLPFDASGMEKYLGKAPAAFLEKPVSPGLLIEELRKIIGL